MTILQADTDAAPSAESLAALNGTYTIYAKASGAAKISLVSTSAEGNGGHAVVNFADPTSAAAGVLGKAADEKIAIGQIIIANDGSVTTKDATAETPTYGEAASWATVSTAHTFSTIYLGLEAKNDSAKQPLALTPPL